MQCNATRFVQTCIWSLHLVVTNWILTDFVFWTHYSTGYTGHKTNGVAHKVHVVCYELAAVSVTNSFRTIMDTSGKIRPIINVFMKDSWLPKIYSLPMNCISNVAHRLNNRLVDFHLFGNKFSPLFTQCWDHVDCIKNIHCWLTAQFITYKLKKRHFQRHQIQLDASQLHIHTRLQELLQNQPREFSLLKPRKERNAGRLM